jgi:hypothetical protein
VEESARAGEVLDHDDYRRSHVCGVSICECAIEVKSEEYIEERINAYRQRAIAAERKQKIAHDNTQVLIDFIRRNLKLYEVPEEWALENGDYLKIDDIYYFFKMKMSETLN